MIGNTRSGNKSHPCFLQSVQMMPDKKETKNRANKSLVYLPQEQLTFQNLQ